MRRGHEVGTLAGDAATPSSAVGPGVSPLCACHPIPSPSQPALALTFDNDGLGWAGGGQHLASGGQGQDPIERAGAAVSRGAGSRIGGRVVVLAVGCVGDGQQAIEVAALARGGHVWAGPALHSVAHGCGGGGGALERQRRPCQLRNGEGIRGMDENKLGHGLGSASSVAAVFCG